MRADILGTLAIREAVAVVALLGFRDSVGYQDGVDILESPVQV